MAAVVRLPVVPNEVGAYLSYIAVLFHLRDQDSTHCVSLGLDLRSSMQPHRRKRLLGLFASPASCTKVRLWYNCAITFLVLPTCTSTN